jgi:capsular exopolysaccharide synthesis family protein
MGKFFEALRKSGIANERPSTEPIAKKRVKISREKADTLKLDTLAAERRIEELPFSRNGMDPRLASALDPGCPAAESFKMLRARILTEALESRPRTITITSPEPLDGKTMVAANLAINIAQGINEHVMIVDCDFRNPSVDRYLGLDTDQGGIREYLENGTSVAPYLVKTPIDKLTALPVGEAPPNPSELLSSEKMRRLVEELKNRYEDRYIIFDSPPAQFAAETTFLGKMVDAVLLVVRSGKTGKNSVLKSMEILDRNKIIGVVFNASDHRPKDYGYYYRYYRKGTA